MQSERAGDQTRQAFHALGGSDLAHGTPSTSMIEDYAAVLAGLQRRGFRLELSADGKSVVQVTSPGGNTLDYPTPDELGHLLRGIAIARLKQQREQQT